MPAIVVVAKVPIEGKSKTRLIPKLGASGSVRLATAMLQDVVETIGSDDSLASLAKVLFYAPPHGESTMRDLLNDLLVGWQLVPMLNSTELTSVDLGAQLKHALKTVRDSMNQGPVLFCGMDCPELPLDEVDSALAAPTVARIVPAADGGYGLLSVPDAAPPSIFDNMRWSSPLTAVAQIKALTDAGIVVQVGRLAHDVDEPSDVDGLCERLGGAELSATSQDVLEQSERPPRQGSCRHTRQALQELGLLREPTCKPMANNW